MEKAIIALQGRTKAPTRLTRNSKLFKTIIKAIKDKKGEQIVSLDLRKINEAVADFFILCEVQSSVQIKSIIDHIEAEVKDNCDERVYHIERGDEWSLMDYVNAVVHIFVRDQRKFYDLEGLWADAERTEHPD